jgi:trk system potassium uptake protein TrkH
MDRPRGHGALVVLTGMAVGALLARRADGSSIISSGLLLLTQGPAMMLWCIRACSALGIARSSDSSTSARSRIYRAWADFGLTCLVLIAAAAAAIFFRNPGAFFAATTTFIAGVLLIEDLTRLYHRVTDEINEPDRLLHILTGPWIGMMLLATALLSLPLATQSGVPDYRHNFWLHILNNAHAAVSAACLVGTTVYSFGEDYSFFGQAVLVLTTQLAGMGMAAVGLSIFLPFMRSAVKLRTVLLISLVLQLLAVAVMWHAWHPADVHSPWDRAWWGLVHAGSALWNSGLTMRTNGLIDYIFSGAIFATITSLSIVGSLSLPVILDLAIGVRRPPPEARRAGRPDSEPDRSGGPWRALPAWEAGAAFVLLLAGAVMLFCFETPWAPEIVWRLPDSWTPQRPLHLGEGQVALRDDMVPASRWTTAVFVSATLRSAGLQSISVMKGAVSWPSYGLLLLWMFIGGSAGGVAGGVRTSCFLLAGICILSRRRTWEARAGVRRMLFWSSMMFVPVWLLANAASVAALGASTDGSLYEVIFDGVAACNSVGLSTGLSLHLSWIGRMIIIMIMIAGRVVPIVFWSSVSSKLGRYLRRQEPGGSIEA